MLDSNVGAAISNLCHFFASSLSGCGRVLRCCSAAVTTAQSALTSDYLAYANPQLRKIYFVCGILLSGNSPIPGEWMRRESLEGKQRPLSQACLERCVWKQ